MNDRFKFRVFDKETGKYYKTRISKGSGCMVYQHPASSHYAWIQIGTMFTELERDEKTYTLTELEPNFIIEQCTGLKDKNGKLIYEGDKVEISVYGDVINGGFVETDTQYQGIVVWAKQGLYVEVVDKFFYIPEEPEDVEIIGNIHEKTEQKD